MVYYRADELLVVDDERTRVERYLTRQGRAVSRKGDESVGFGVRRYVVTGLDVAEAIRAVREETPAGAQVVAPNHIFLSTPYNHGGPFGPPVPVPASHLRPRLPVPAPVPVAIIDTGLWKDSALPESYFTPDQVDVETETDIDNDGVLDGDVGHANFIAGVIVRHAPYVTLSVLRVLDTFGVCTESDLVAALDRLDPSVRVVNLSLGGFTLDDRPPLGLQAAMARALDGVDRVAVAAAGNNGNRTDRFWPAAFAAAGHSWSSQVAAVAAHDGRELCEWSNAGDWVTLVAPGQDVESTYIRHPMFPSGWAQWSGTSFATPRVAAEIAGQIRRTGSAIGALQQVIASAPHRFGGYAGIR